jgi:hypothetical protein
LRERDLPGGAGIGAATARQLMALQETRGNDYVQRSVSEAGPKPVDKESTADAAQALRPDTSAGRSQSYLINRFVTLPSLAAITATVSQREWMRNTIRDLGMRLIELKNQMKKLEEDTAYEELDELTEEVWVWLDVINGEEPQSTEDLRFFKDFVAEAEDTYASNLGILTRRATEALAPIADAEEPDVSAVLDDLQEAAHFAFIEASEDQIGAVSDAIEKVQGYQGEVAKVLKWAKSAAKAARDAETLASLEKAIGKVKGAGGILEKMSNVAKSAHAVATIAGLDNKAVASYQDDINKFEAAIEAMDVALGVLDAVPLLGTLWSKYYMPVTKRCLELVRELGRHRDLEGRQMAFIKFMQTGELPAKAELKFFPGGRPVLRFMLAIMGDETPAVTPSVERFFLEHKGLFNLPFEGGHNELESEGGASWYDPSSWSDEEKLKNLVPWVRRNRYLVWAMLYGSLELPW